MAEATCALRHRPHRGLLASGLNNDIDPPRIGGTDPVSLSDKLDARRRIALHARAADPELQGPRLDGADEVTTGECDPGRGHGEPDDGCLPRLELHPGIPKQ